MRSNHPDTCRYFKCNSEMREIYESKWQEIYDWKLSMTALKLCPPSIDIIWSTPVICIVCMLTAVSRGYWIDDSAADLPRYRLSFNLLSDGFFLRCNFRCFSVFTVDEYSVMQCTGGEHQILLSWLIGSMADERTSATETKCAIASIVNICECCC